MVTTPIITFIADLNEPDLYNDVNMLPDPFTMNVPIGILNTHPSATLYFKMIMASPPAGFSDYEKELGSLAPNVSQIFMYSFLRDMPSLTDGEYDESVDMVVEAYTDSGYSSFYATQTLTVAVHHFDHADPAWTVLYHDTFDGVGNDDWGGVNTSRGATYFITSPYSLNLGPFYVTGKWFTVGAFDHARFVIHVWSRETFDQPTIIIDDVAKRSDGVGLPPGVWVRLSFNCPVDKSFLVSLPPAPYAGQVCIDEVWLIAK